MMRRSRQGAILTGLIVLLACAEGIARMKTRRLGPRAQALDAAVPSIKLPLGAAVWPDRPLVDGHCVIAGPHGEPVSGTCTVNAQGWPSGGILLPQGVKPGSPGPWPRARFEWTSGKLLDGIEMITFGNRQSGYSGALEHYEESDLNVAIGSTLLIIPARTNPALAQAHAVSALAEVMFLGSGDPPDKPNSIALALQQLDASGQWATLASNTLSADHGKQKQTVSSSALVAPNQDVRMLLTSGSGGSRTRVQVMEAFLDLPQCIPDLSTGSCIGEGSP